MCRYPEIYCRSTFAHSLASLIKAFSLLSRDKNINEQKALRPFHKFLITITNQYYALCHGKFPTPLWIVPQHHFSPFESPIKGIIKFYWGGWSNSLTLSKHRHRSSSSFLLSEQPETFVRQSWHFLALQLSLNMINLYWEMISFEKKTKLWTTVILVLNWQRLKGRAHCCGV